MNPNGPDLSKDTPPTEPMKEEMRQKFNNLIMNNSGYFSRLLYKFTEVTTNIMGTSKGRNKICSLIQYSANLVYECQVNSNIPEIAEMIMYRNVTQAPRKPKERPSLRQNLLLDVEAPENFQPLQVRGRVLQDEQSLIRQTNPDLPQSPRVRLPPGVFLLLHPGQLPLADLFKHP